MRARWAWLLGACLVWLAASVIGWSTPAGAQTSAANLLAGRLPVRSEGVTRAERLTDGLAAVRGDHWNTDRTAVFKSSASFAEYDLGEEVTVTAGYLIADNNDTYSITISKDGSAYAPLWEAGSTGGRGLQPRLVDNLSGNGRYVRITATSGDASYSVSELQLFAGKPDPWPPTLPERPGVPPDERLRNLTLSFGLALSAFALLSYAGAPIWWLFLLLLIPVFGGWELSNALQDAWPVGQREIAILRGAMALTAFLAVLREGFAPKRYLAHRGATLSVLAVCGVVSVASFFNLGQPQYLDHKLNEPSFVHNFDMRVYYPVAKYFKELRFDGLYKASVAAYVDDDPSVSLDSLASVQLRDLKNHRMTSVAQVRGEIEEVKTRFSPERWQQFVVDMRYFRENMGVRDYLGSMHDHGGNATPVWLTVGYFLFKSTTASNQTLFAAAMLDPVLLLLAFLAIGRTFGSRTMFVSMVLWGANDFYMFGTNWAGATLRHDWMAYLAFGLCALRKERWALAGFFLAASAMIRAFPALALVALGIPVGYWLAKRIREKRGLPSWAEFRRAQAPFLRVALAATLTVLGLMLVSSLVLSFDAWGEWLHKVNLLNRDPHVNHVSWRGLVAGPDGEHIRIWRGRMPLYIAGVALYAGLIILAARRRSYAAVAALGLIMIPVAFHPANYYIHFIFLMPLIAVERHRRGVRTLAFGDALLWAAFLAICAAQYWTTRVSDLGLHFHLASALLFTAITLGLLALLLQDAAEDRGILTLLDPELALAGATTGAVDDGAAVHAHGGSEDEGNGGTDDDGTDNDDGTDSDEGPGDDDRDNAQVDDAHLPGDDEGEAEEPARSSATANANDADVAKDEASEAPQPRAHAQVPTDGPAASDAGPVPEGETSGADDEAPCLGALEPERDS
ncbi:MAG: hypothetical protein R3B13_36090 [Polyangiaceae bacterium]